MNEQNHQIFNVGVKAMIRRDDKVLVLHCSDKDFWELPGGRIDEGETISETLKREIYEETGAKDIHIGDIVDTQIGQFSLKTSLPVSMKLLLLFFEAEIEDHKPVLSSEHDDFRWISQDEVEGLQLLAADRAAIQQLLQRTPS